MIIKVSGPVGVEHTVVLFQIGMHTPLKKLMNTYCERQVSINY